MKKTIVGYIAKTHELDEVLEWGIPHHGISALTGAMVYRDVPAGLKGKYKKIKIIVDVKEVKDGK